MNVTFGLIVELKDKLKQLGEEKEHFSKAKARYKKDLDDVNALLEEKALEEEKTKLLIEGLLSINEKIN